MNRTAQEIIDAEFQSNTLHAEDSIGTVVHYTISLHNEEAEIGDEVAKLMHEKISRHYPAFRVEMKTWLAPNHEFNIRASVWQH